MTARRIAIAGFQHETNSFAPGRAGVEEFRMADSWPGLLLGDEVIAATRGMNLPIAGAVAAAEEIGGIELVPILWCAAEPSGPVTDAAFDRFSGMILDGLRRAGRLDGVYLDLHGAMVTDSLQDGEGALLARVRAAIGAEMALGTSLDLHANVSAQMVGAASLITIYRTNPHLDMAETGARCLRELVRSIDGGPPRAAFRQAPFLVPLHAQGTGTEPCRSLYRLLDELPVRDGDHAELAMGFTAADIHDCGPSVVAYAGTVDRAEALADAVMDRLVASEGAFDTGLLSAEEAVARAMAADAGGPVVIADVQDNPGAGGTSDSTGLLRALIECRAPQAILGVLNDPEFAARAHRAGVGAVIEGALGGRSGLPGQAPVPGRFRVLALSDGRIAYTGEMYGGGTAAIGPSCLVSVEGIAGDVRVVVGSQRTQCLDRAFFTHFGADPARTAIVCVKSTLHFRADFEPGCGAILNAAAPGAFPCRLEEAPYRNLRKGLRLGPRGPASPGPRGDAAAQ